MDSRSFGFESLALAGAKRLLARLVLDMQYMDRIIGNLRSAIDRQAKSCGHVFAATRATVCPKGSAAIEESEYESNL